MVTYGNNSFCCWPGRRFNHQLFHFKITIMTPDEQLESFALQLPPAPVPVGVYIPFLIDGKHCYVSGHGPLLPDKSLMRGRVGQDMDPEQGKLAARQVGLAILATLKHHLGSLDKIKRVIKVLG